MILILDMNVFFNTGLVEKAPILDNVIDYSGNVKNQMKIMKNSYTTNLELITDLVNLVLTQRSLYDRPKR